MRLVLLALICCAVSFAPLSAQSCGWNGGQLRLSSDPQAIDKTVTYRLEGVPGQAFFLFLSDGTASFPLPPVGTVCLDIASPTFQLFAQGALDAGGAAAFPLVIPNDPALLSLPPLAVQAIAGDPGHTSGSALSSGLRVSFENANSYASVSAIGTPRALATSTKMGDGRVLVAGGGNGTITSPVGASSALIFDPFLRTVSAAPAMSQTRSLHTATALNDGRVLVIGGVIDANGTVGTQCELFDPLTGLWSPAAGMSVARAAHAAELLSDGRVLIVGGTASFAGGSTSIGGVLNGSSDGGEVYDPVTNTWSPVLNTMSSKRFLPTATRLDDGRILIVSGLSGATSIFGQEVPTWTSSVDYFDPAQNRFVAAPGIGSANARGGAAAMRQPNGDIWVVGGAAAGLLLPIPTATDSTRIFRAGNWIAGPNLPEAVVLPALATLSDGSTLVAGGVSGTLTAPGASSRVARYAGGVLTSVAPLPAPRGTHAIAALDDGGVWIAGGADGSATAQATAWIYTPSF